MIRRSNLRALMFMLAATSAAPAQWLLASPVIHGQPFMLAASSTTAPPGEAVFLYSLTGIGPGTCFFPGFCLDLLDPWAIFTIVPLDGLGVGFVTGTVPPDLPLVTISMQAVCVTFSGAVIGINKTSTASRTVQTLDALSDPFDGAALSSAWTIHEAAEMAAPLVQNGAVLLQPTATGPAATWFQDEEGPALFKRVTGDFTVSAAMHVFNPASLSPIPVPPPISYRLAGLIARDPASAAGARNSVHVALGAGDPAVPVALEDKTTVSSQSSFMLHATSSIHQELQMQRSGATFTLRAREIGTTTWSVVATHVRPDLPATLDVGPMIYSNQAPPFVAALIDAVVFGP
jgi:hypothetical protein